MKNTKEALSNIKTAYKKTAHFAVAPVAWSIEQMATKSGGDYDFSGINRAFGLLTLPWTTLATAVTLPAGVLGLAAVTGVAATALPVTLAADALSSGNTSGDIIEKPISETKASASQNQHNTTVTVALKETIPATTAWFVLNQLQEKNLTVAHLNEWYGDDYFTMDHAEALIYLMMKRQLEPERAIIELNGLNRKQAQAIGVGLKKAEVIDLVGDQPMALFLLKKHGLTADHLKHWQGSEFTGNHTLALQILLNKKPKMSPEKAIAEISHLNNDQARYLAFKDTSIAKQNIFVEQRNVGTFSSENAVESNKTHGMK